MIMSGQRQRLASMVRTLLWLLLKPWLRKPRPPRIFWYRSGCDPRGTAQGPSQPDVGAHEPKEANLVFWPESSNCDFLPFIPPRFFRLEPSMPVPVVRRVQPSLLPGKVISLTPREFLLSPPATQAPPFSFPRPCINAVAIEPLLVPKIFGRVRRLPRDEALDKADKKLAHDQLTRSSPAPSLIPPELWNLLWEILSPPPRVEELVARRYPGQLRPYQVEGVQSLIEKERFILADEMGLGKTVQVCVALSLLIRMGRVKNALIICPKTTLSVWHDHLESWLPEAEVHSHNDPLELGLLRADGPPRVWVLPYSRVSRRGAAITWGRNWDVLVLDEVHEVRNPETVKYREISWIAHRVRYRWGLSGTPLQNRLEELTAIFGIIKPELKLRAENMSLPQVREVIRPCLRRVRRKEALPDLPPKQRREIWLELDEAQARAYTAVLRREKTGFDTGRAMTFTHIWQVLGELKKICNFAPGSAVSPKLEKLLEIVKTVLAKGEKLVVFTQYVTVGLEPLMPHLKPFGLAVIHGGCTDVERREAVRRFQTDPQCRVFLGTVGTSGFGLTLTAANHVVHFDHWWNPAVMWQAEDRVYRIGQTRPVTVYEFWMKNTVEERIRKILEQKGLLHYEVIDRLSDSEFKRLFTLEELITVLDLEPAPARARTTR